MKRRVIAIAVVLAAVGLVWLALWRNEGPLWRAVMLKTVRSTSENPGTIVLMCVWRWGNNKGVKHGPWWQLFPSGQVDHYVMENDNQKPGSTHTRWGHGPEGKILFQNHLSTTGTRTEYRSSPPWWPHPRLIDLSEF